MINDSLLNERKPIFFDKKGKRWRVFNYLGVALATVITGFLVFFVVSVLINPFLPQIRLKPIAALPQQEDTRFHLPENPLLTKHDPALKQTTDKVKLEKNRREEIKRQKLVEKEMFLATKPEPPVTSSTGKPLAIGFYVNWDDSSYASLKRNISELDWLVPEWIRLSGDDNNSLVLDIDQPALDLIQQEKPNMPVLPLLQNYKNEQWNSTILAKAVATEDSRRKLINSLLETVAKYKFGGITIDIEEVPPDVQTKLFMFMEELHVEFQKHNLTLAQAVPFDNPDWNYRAYSSVNE